MAFDNSSLLDKTRNIATFGHFYHTKNDLHHWYPLLQPYLEFITQSESIDTWIDEKIFPTLEDMSDSLTS